MTSYWQQWSAQEIDYCLGRDFRALTEEEDTEESDFMEDESEDKEDEDDGYELSMECLGFSNSDFF